MGKSKELAELGDVVTQSNGNVGIGVSNPNYSLHVKGTTDTNAIVAVESASWTTNSSAELRLSYVGGYNRSIKGHYDNGLELYTNNSNPAVSIDPSGRVTMPYQPAFQAVLPTNSIMVGGLTTIPFTTVLLDVSNGLNNGNFTAPVSGNYFISASLSFDGGKDASDDTGFFGIYKNNTAYIRQVYNPIKWSLAGVENTTSIAGVVYLSAGDTVQIRHYEITQTPSPQFLANYCNFSGYLIG